MSGGPASAVRKSKDKVHLEEITTSGNDFTAWDSIDGGGGGIDGGIGGMDGPGGISLAGGISATAMRPRSAPTIAAKKGPRRVGSSKPKSRGLIGGSGEQREVLVADGDWQKLDSWKAMEMATMRQRTADIEQRNMMLVEQLATARLEVERAGTRVELVEEQRQGLSTIAERLAAENQEIRACSHTPTPGGG